MSFFYIHPDDRRWLKRWFRNNLVCFAVIVLFLLTLRLSTAVRPEPVVTDEPVAAAHEVVVPEGWRRTNRGWEHTSRWQLAEPSDATRYASVALVQPIWATTTMETVRNTSPLVIAVMQITAIALIVRTSRK